MKETEGAASPQLISDSERLDWLEANPHSVGRANFELPWRAYGPVWKNFATAREAIDAAMSSRPSGDVPAQDAPAGPSHD